GLGYRYITGPQKKGATKGKYYQEIPKNKSENDFQSDGIAISNFYDYADAFGNCRHEGGVELRSGKKPEVLLKKIIEIGTKEDDIILDFHMGTGGTMAVAHKMGRQYIGIEQLNYKENGSVTRLKNVINGDTTGISKSVNWKGGGNFIYCELARYNEDFIEKIEEAKDTKVLLKIWEEMKRKSFINYNIDIKKIEEDIEEFKNLPMSKQKEILISTLNKNQLYVNLSEMSDSYFSINKEDKELNKKFYEF
ncbi:MAG: DNA methyltransferase, partial [Candidatus Nanoarchaeia archaeon]